MKRARYSFMEHLARSVLFSKYREDYLMAMFTSYTAYFDAAGHPKKMDPANLHQRDPKYTVMTVAGFVSTVNKWTRFDTEWNAILKSEGIKIFHMTDFVSSEGEFRTGWRGETDKRRVFINHLAACLKKNVNKSFRVTLLLNDYDEVNQIFKIEEVLGLSYSVCARSCLDMLYRWAQRKKAENKTLCYFEKGDLDWGNLDAKAAELNIPIKPEVLSKDRAVAFQAADFAGWKIRTAIQEAIKDDHTLQDGIKLLHSIEVLRKIPRQAGVLNRDSLAAFCKICRVPKRVP